MALMNQVQKLELYHTLITYLQNDIVGKVTIEPDDHLFEAGILDSMGMMKLVRFIEMRFTLQVPFEDMTLENFRTIKSISDYVSIKS